MNFAILNAAKPAPFSDGVGVLHQRVGTWRFSVRQTLPRGQECLRIQADKTDQQFEHLILDMLSHG